MIRRAALAVLLIGLAARGGEEDAPSREQLKALQDFVGEWSGAGLPKAGGAEKGWSEESEWAWSFKDGVAIVFQAEGGKYYASGRIVPGAETGTYRFEGTTPDGKVEAFTGKLKRSELELDAEAPAAGRPSKLFIGVVAKGKRLVMTFLAGNRQLAEIGYTRKGSNFGKDAEGPECVVTGGLGTSTVSYKGQTYHVCCSGCRSEFNENPEKILAEYAERKKKEKEGQ